MYFHIGETLLDQDLVYQSIHSWFKPPTALKGPIRNRANNRKDRRWGRACRHRAVTSHMQEVTSQDSAADLVGIAPAQEQSSQTDMQEGQWEQDPWAPVTIPRLCYLPPLGQGLLQVHDLGLAAAELRLQLLTCLWEEQISRQGPECKLGRQQKNRCWKFTWYYRKT